MFDFVKRIAIGVAISMCVFFLKSQVFALTVDSRLQYLDNNEQTVNTSYVSAGTLMSIKPSTVYTFTSIFVRFNQSFLANNIYRISFRFLVNSNFYQLHKTCPDYYSISSGIEILSSSCAEVGDRYADVQIAFRTSSAVSTLTIGLKYQVILPANYQTSFIVTSNSWDVQNVDSTYEAVVNNTQIIGNAIDGVTNYIDYQTAVIEAIHTVLDRFDNATIGDEPADIRSRNYSGTNTSGLGQNDTAGGSGLGSGGSGGYGLNFNDFTAPFAFVFARVEEFLNLNAMFLTYLINIITLGFIGLVLNR